MATRSTARRKNRPSKKLPPQRLATTTSKHFLSDKVSHFTESVIREMTRQAMLHDAVNLAQGFPDFSAPADIKKEGSAYDLPMGLGVLAKDTHGSTIRLAPPLCITADEVDWAVDQLATVVKQAS